MRKHKKFGSGPGVVNGQGPEFALRVGMVEVVVTRMMMVPGAGKGRAGKDHQEQGCSKNFLHGKTLAWLFPLP